ncbi:MAG: hypothetical protein ACLQFI_22480 [Methylocella sp.]
MTGTDWRTEQLVQKLRRGLPLAAHGRPLLTAALRWSLSRANVMPRLTFTDVFYAGEENGLMCRVGVLGLANQPVVIVAPITQLAFNQRHRAARDIAAYRKHCAETAAATCLGVR